MKLEFQSNFLEDLCSPKAFLPQIIVLENLHFDLEKAWKSPGKMHMKKCANIEFLFKPLITFEEKDAELTLFYSCYIIVAPTILIVACMASGRTLLKWFHKETITVMPCDGARHAMLSTVLGPTILKQQCNMFFCFIGGCCCCEV